MAESSQSEGCYELEELQSLQGKGVVLPSPAHVCIGREVPLENIGADVTLHPFTRLHGTKTQIFEGAEIGPQGSVTLKNSVVGRHSVVGNQGSVTLVDTHLGPNTILGQGVAEQSVFLGKESDENDFTTGVGFRVRKGSLYEEDASSAQHTDTKMTILFPWVTLGSNVNLCDLMLTGGTGPELGAFTEVGSGTIHFNFTLRGDKATASLLGNVPDGAFLNEQRLFIGGNNSLLGPLHAEFGAFTAAGIRATGSLKEGLNLGQGMPSGHTDYNPQIFSQAQRVIEQQVHYIGQLTALYHWYREIRALLASKDPERKAVYAAGQAVVVRNILERIQQTERYAHGLETSIRILSQTTLPPRNTIEEQTNLFQNWPRLKQHLEAYESHVWEVPERLVSALQESASQHTTYTQVISHLDSDAVKLGKTWLHAIVHRCEHFFKNELKPSEHSA